MKALLTVSSFLVAAIAWCGAVVDFFLAKISEIPRPYLVPARTFVAAFHATRAYLTGQPVDWHGIRAYPRRRCF